MDYASERAVGRWQAEDDEGHRYTVIEWQMFTIFRPISGPAQEVPGVVRLALDTGQHVNPYEGGKFQIFDNDVIIKRV